jgi:lysozyme family protein
MANFEAAIGKLLKLEGGYVNHPLDPGGKTKYGITEETARSYGYKGEMKDLPLEFAKSVYKKGYWDSLSLDLVNSDSVAWNVFDCAVNCGVATSAKMLQRSLNVMNNRQKLWKDLVVDGKVGKKTIEALNTATLKSHNTEAIIKCFNVLRGYHYITICEKREENEVFSLGWVLHRLHVDVRE